MMHRNTNLGRDLRAPDSCTADTSEALRAARVRSMRAKEAALTATLANMIKAMPLGDETRTRIAQLIDQDVDSGP